MTFHLGKPILLLALLAVACGVAGWLHGQPDRPDLVVWVFADDNARTYRQSPPDGGPSLIEQFHQRTGKSVQVDLIAQRALDVRLLSLFMAPSAGTPPPDLVEIDVSSIGKYFRPPIGEVGFLPLNDFLAHSAAARGLVRARLATWSKHGVIFGIPRDVHPVTLTYRKDLFDEAGVDLERVRTWPQFQTACLRFQHYWAEHGFPNRRAMELYSTQSEELLMMLLQRHINIVDDRNRIRLSDPRVAETTAFYAQLVAGPRKIAADTIPNFAFAYRDLADGSVCAMITPDWRAGYVKEYAPELAGKLRMRDLPVFQTRDSPTSTWGGTMMGIPRGARDPQMAWKLLEFLCFSPQAMAERHRYSEIIPPIKSLWTDPIYQSDDPFFGGQAIDQLYISLAAKIPTRYVTPFSIAAQAGLTLVLDRAVGYMKQRDDATGLEEQCQLWLDQASGELAEWVQYGDLDQ
ncbi:MAG TPA: extracellular solute-binding protein [Tepidisphaeraceae bacterium]|nr:extracellular solute-binding protein [Tepidisphaeraceae bacterium]